MNHQCCPQRIRHNIHLRLPSLQRLDLLSQIAVSIGHTGSSLHLPTPPRHLELESGNKDKWNPYHEEMLRETTCCVSSWAVESLPASFCLRSHLSASPLTGSATSQQNHWELWDQVFNSLIFGGHLFKSWHPSNKARKSPGMNTMERFSLCGVCNMLLVHGLGSHADVSGAKFLGWGPYASLT